MDLGQRGPAQVQVVIAGVDVGFLGNAESY
jgi:hypothetical protein